MQKSLLMLIAYFFLCISLFKSEHCYGKKSNWIQTTSVGNRSADRSDSGLFWSAINGTYEVTHATCHMPWGKVVWNIDPTNAYPDISLWLLNQIGGGFQQNADNFYIFIFLKHIQLIHNFESYWCWKSDWIFFWKIGSDTIPCLWV